MIVDGDGKLAFIHVKEHAQDAFLLELLAAKCLPISSIAVPQLTNGIVGPAKRVVAEGSLQIELPVLRYSDFDLVLRSGISNDLPVVDALIETLVGNHCPEQVSLFLQEYRSILRTNLDHI